MAIRPYREADRGDILRLSDEIFGPPRVTGWQPSRQIESLEKDCIKLVPENERLRVYAAAYALDDSHFRLDLLVPHGLAGDSAADLLGRIESDVRRAGGKYLQARIPENAVETLELLLSTGFEEIHRMRGMSLSAVDFKPDRWIDAGRDLEAQGILAATLADEMRAGRDPESKLGRLLERAREGWPSPDPTKPGKMAAGDLGSFFTGIASPELASIAKYQDKYIAFTSAAPGNQLGTAVHPDFRGRGIAALLKAVNILNCIKNGHKEFESCSASPAMQKVNVKLGYEFTGQVEVRLLKRLIAF